MTKKKKELVKTIQKITWKNDLKNWDATKKENLNILYNSNKFTFLAHTNDTIKGKPQLISQTKITLPLIR